MSAPSFISFPQRLADAPTQWRLAMWQWMCTLRVASPGVIQSFNPATQTATVKLVITENINNPDTLVPEPTPIPLLVDVPVMMFRAGIFSLTFPVAAGDECLVIFNDNCYNAWWANGAKDSNNNFVNQNQEVKRRHDLSDGFAIVGLWSQPRVLQNYSANSVQLRTEDGSKIVEIQAGEINIQTSDASPIVINASGSGKVTVESATEVDVAAPTVKISGGGTSIDAKTFLTHTHSGVSTGGGNTGPVV